MLGSETLTIAMPMKSSSATTSKNTSVSWPLRVDRKDAPGGAVASVIAGDPPSSRYSWISQLTNSILAAGIALLPEVIRR